MLTSGHRRTAFALAENIRMLAARFGVERLGFLTLTFRDHVTDIREAQRRFNSLRTHVLSERYAASIAVPERMLTKRVHFHLIVVCPADIRTGVDFKAIAAGDYRSAGSWLRSEWAFWRRTAPKFGFGRTELLPVRSTTEGIAKYVGKYVAKHIDQRLPEDKGARLVRYTASARQVGTRFAWAGVRPWLWRQKLARFAADHGCRDLDDMRGKFGRRWAYRLSEHIAAVTLEEYPTGVHAEADGHGWPREWGDPRVARDVVIRAPRVGLEVDGLKPYAPPPMVSAAPSPVWRAVVRLVGEDLEQGWQEERTGAYVAAGARAAPKFGAKQARGTALGASTG
jgi:hypothetical protein